MAAACNLNAFALLSNDIIFDVLKIGCPKFEDLEKLERTDGRWADVICCGRKFALGRLYAMVDKKGHHQKWFNDGPKTAITELEDLCAMQSWDDLLFTSVYLDIGCLSVEFENRILRHVTRRTQELVVHFEQEQTSLERVAEVSEFLASSPINALKIYFDFRADVFTEHFKKMLMNPSLHTLHTSYAAFGKTFEELDFHDAFLDFVKRPNFIYLNLYIHSADSTNKLLTAVVEHWLQMTVFPSQIQFVDISNPRNLEDSLLYELGFRKVAKLSLYGCFMYIRDHPTDASKQIEAFSLCLTLRVCLTSKEASVGKEFGEYRLYEMVRRRAVLEKN